MDKRPHSKKIILIILLIISLILGMIFTYIKVAFNEDSFIYYAKHIDIPTYLNSEDKIYKILDDKKIPIEVFNYIDMKEYERQVDLFFDKKEVSRETINDLLVNSVKEYENINLIDVYSNISSDIDDITDIIYTKVNNEELFSTIDSINTIGNISYVFIALNIILTLLIIFINKDLLYAGIPYIGVSTIMFLSLKGEISTKAKEYLNNQGVDYLSERLSNTCSIYFILGIIIVVIYLIFYVKNIFKNLKRSYIDYEWRYK